jgi:patatin-related protein
MTFNATSGLGGSEVSPSSPLASAMSPAAKTEDGNQHAAMPTDNYRQEIRFAIVMYGGVSLAIYIHGVAQELLRLARATSGADLTGDPVSQIYHRISSLVRDKDGTRCPARFVIDILSGTSAGGINAVFLAKAIAIRSQNLENLRQTWLDVADMNKLLNTGGTFEPKRSLLKGDWMYQQLKKAFEAMNTAPKDPQQCYKPERLDLFVTTTDLNGAAVPIRLADMDVLEKVHKGCFNFRLDNIPLTSKDPAGKSLDAQLHALVRDDFRPDFDALLAFAARCTSSFPLAFAPMKLVSIKPEIGEDTYTERKKTYESFFSWVPPGNLYPQGCKDLDTRELADGGYLDNKPFGHAIDAMTFRAARLPHQRKLLYVDPFPEVAADEECHPHFDFIENGMAAAMTLPRYQTIREEIARVEFSNITQERLLRLREMVNGNIPKDDRKTFNRTVTKAEHDKRFEETRVTELVGKLGTLYATYHEVRLLDVTDDLARIVSVTHENAQSQDFFLAIRYLVRAWRSDSYQPNGEHGKRLETQFFTEFDYSFRLRRVVKLLECAQEELPEACDSLIQQLTRLLRTRERLSLQDKDLNPLWETIQKVGTELSWDEVKAILEPIPDGARLARAQQLYGDHKQSLNLIADSIKAQWEVVFDVNRRQLKELLDTHNSLREQYELFDFDDMTSLAFLEGSDVSEHTETEIYRISPVDGIDRPLEKKLAGYALWDFGSFLEREWRLNDMLWGRLDACERIVSALLNDPADQACRDGFVKSLQEAIVKQEADRWVRLEPALPALQQGTLKQYLEDKYEVPGPPPAAQSASQIAKATDILGRMIEEDVGIKNSTTQKLRTLARAAEGVIALLVPGTLGRAFLNYWLELLFVMSALMFLAGRLATDEGVKRFGQYGLAVAILLALLAWAFGTLLGQKSAGENKLPGHLVRFIKWVPALVLTILVLIGCRHFLEDWQAVLGAIHH